MEDDDQPVIQLGAYSIQWVEASPGRCVVCDVLTVGNGPVGFKHDDPTGATDESAAAGGALCDPCLLQFQPRLGMLLMLANICRELADVLPDDPWDQDRRQAVLMAVARLYHAQESREWRMRPLNVLDFWERHGKDLGSISLDRWVETLRGRDR